MTRRALSQNGGGFSLLEVMVAMGILTISLTAIFSSEAASIKVAHRARKMTIASLLARCKMGEVEELLAKEGLPGIEKHGTDGCCEDAEVDGFECEWSVVRVDLPDPELEGDALGLDEEEGEEGGAGSMSVEDMLSGASGAPGGDMLAELAMSYAYPILQPVIEEQVRRATVSVNWREGSREHHFEVVQYVVGTGEEEVLP